VFPFESGETFFLVFICVLIIGLSFFAPKIARLFSVMNHFPFR